MIKDTEHLVLFKGSDQIKEGANGVDTISITGLTKGDKVATGDYVVGIKDEGATSAKIVLSVPAFTVGTGQSTTTTTTTSTTSTTAKPTTTSTTTSTALA